MHFIKMNGDICVYVLVLAVISVHKFKNKNVEKITKSMEFNISNIKRDNDNYNDNNDNDNVY